MKVMKTMFGVCLSGFSLLLASCGAQTETDQPESGFVETVTVTRDVQIQLLPMAQVGEAATRAVVDDEDKKKEAIHVTYNTASCTRADKGWEDMTEDEMKIKSAYVLQFAGTTPWSTLLSKTQITAAQLKAGTPVTCSFRMKPGVKNRVYVVVNSYHASLSNINSSKLKDLELPEDVPVSESVSEEGLLMTAYQDVGVGDEFKVFQVKNRMAKLTVTSPGTLTLKNRPSGVSAKPEVPGDRPIRYGEEDIYYGVSDVPLVSGKTYYVPENLSGRNELVHKAYLRALGLAPDTKAMYVEVKSGANVFQLLLGDGDVSDFNVAGNCAYNITVSAIGSNGYDLRLNNPIQTPLVDINKTQRETANCYIISSANTWYYFDATVAGNGKTTAQGTDYFGKFYPEIRPGVLNTESAQLLWESDNTEDVPAAGSIVNHNVYVLRGGKVLFKTGAKVGNALIAARDATNNIIWSWHIWRAEEPEYCELQDVNLGGYALGQGLQIMDRNLGAFRAAPDADITSIDYGLYYQWGRKDPFPYKKKLQTTIKDCTLDWAVGFPTAYYELWNKGNHSNLWGGALVDKLTIQGNYYGIPVGSKTIYDPCPAGWRVMPSYAFVNAEEKKPTHYTNYADFTSIIHYNGITLSLPYAGYFGDLGTPGWYFYSGTYWSCSPFHDNSSNEASCLHFTKDALLRTQLSLDRTYSLPVRCVKEWTPYK